MRNSPRVVFLISKNFHSRWAKQPCNSLRSHQIMADAKAWGSKNENSSAAKAADSSYGVLTTRSPTLLSTKSGVKPPRCDARQ